MPCGKPFPDEVPRFGDGDDVGAVRPLGGQLGVGRAPGARTDYGDRDRSVERLADVFSQVDVVIPRPPSA
jgi:hypothetical protein